MKIRVADVKGSHGMNPDCPMRLALSPRGVLYCVDCGIELISQTLEIGHAVGYTFGMSAHTKGVLEYAL